MNTQQIEQHGFRLIEKVDETSKTVVWKAIQETLDRTVILRVLKDEEASRPTEVEHFLMIARRVARVKSDSLVSVFDIVSDGALHYVVTEHVDGPTLAEQVAAQGPITVEQALWIAAHLSESLDQLWSTAGIVHRNLKSSTIRLDPRGVAKITDFCLAIEAASDDTAADATPHSLIVDTPCFLSPEQAKGSHPLNTQCDMYALGVILYHLVTGLVPFEELDVREILAAHIHHEIIPPHRIRHDVPLKFSWFLHRLMMKAPDDRYATWADVLADIQSLLEGTQPACVRPEEVSPSTIARDEIIRPQGTSSTAKKKTPRIRFSLKTRDSKIASLHSNHLTDEHAKEIRTGERTRAGICWLVLIAWLLLVFWFRAVYQNNGHPATDPRLMLSQATASATATLMETLDNLRASPDVPAQQPPEDQTAAPQPAPLPAETLAPPAPPAAAKTEDASLMLRAHLVKALAAGDLPAAQNLLQSAPSSFPNRAELAALVGRIPEPDTLISDSLKTQVGHPLQFEHNGTLRIVTLRSLTGNTLRVEANGKTAELTIPKLSPDQKLRWMPPPETAEQHAAYCLVLMRSSRRAELSAYASKTKSLEPLLQEAARAVTGVGSTPRAE